MKAWFGMRGWSTVSVSHCPGVCYPSMLETDIDPGPLSLAGQGTGDEQELMRCWSGNCGSQGEGCREGVAGYHGRDDD